MSKSNRARGILAMTRHLEIDYLRPVPLGVPLTLSGRHTGTIGRRNHVEGQLADDAGNVLATAKAVFVTVTPDLLQKATARNAAPTL
jgi:acyl-CoA thioesterase FadM